MYIIHTAGMFLYVGKEFCIIGYFRCRVDAPLAVVHPSQNPDVHFRCRIDAPLTVVRSSQNPDLRLSRIRLFAKRIVHIYQLYTLTYIRGLTSG